MKELNIGTCKGRHEMPVEKFVFETIDDPTNIVALRKTVWDFIGENFYEILAADQIKIFVTGLTVAVVEIINQFKKVADNIVLMHYDVKTHTYYSQKLL